jgi:hypothetical protein
MSQQENLGNPVEVLEAPPEGTPLRKFAEMLRNNVDLFERHWVAEHKIDPKNWGTRRDFGDWIFQFQTFLEQPDEYRNKHSK